MKRTNMLNQYNISQINHNHIFSLNNNRILEDKAIAIFSLNYNRILEDKALAQTILQTQCGVNRNYLAV